jgi:hypothetical protein
MADFTTLKAQVNTASSTPDASPTFTDMLFGTANYELRLCGSGAGGASIASASWPTYLRPGSVGVIPEMWGYFGADASGGVKIAAYDGTSAHYKQFLVSWDALGTFAAANILSFWKDNTLPAASAGTQPSAGSGGDGSSFVNGQTTDTSSTSYIKMNAYGSGKTAGGTQETPSANAAGTLTATSGTAGAATPGAGAFLATWQSGQAATQWIAGPATPAATSAGLWYFVLAFYTGPNMTGGTLVPVLGFQYQWV